MVLILNFIQKLMQQEPHPSMTKLETNVEESIRSMSSTTRPTCDAEYNIDFTATGSNVSITSAVCNTANTADVTDTTAVNPTYADLVKRTNTAPLPDAAQTVIYDKVTGDINKVLTLSDV